MRYLAVFSILLSSLNSSSLHVYQDGAIYTLPKDKTFIGFSKDVVSTCGVIPMEIDPLVQCPLEDRLCKEHNNLTKLILKQDKITNTLQTLNLFESNVQPQTINTKEWLDAAQNIGEQKALLKHEQEILNQQIQSKKGKFTAQAPSMTSYEINRDNCIDAVELKLPYGQISFRHHYMANILKNDKIEITHALKIINKSGIDIDAKDVKLFYRSLRTYVPAVSFSPWVVYKDAPQKYATKPSRSSVMEMNSAVMPAVASPAPQAVYEDAREYSIKNLFLPSTGKDINFDISKETIQAKCELYLYPYQSLETFTACKFTPNLEVESHQWEVREESKIVNTNARGAYTDGQYTIYTTTNEEISASRESVIYEDTSSGIFGNTVRKKDGFEIVLLNKSNKKQDINVVERLPVSTTDEITVKLISIQGIETKSYTQDKDGRIDFKLSLEPNEEKKITVLFEVSHHKDITPSY